VLVAVIPSASIRTVSSVTNTGRRASRSYCSAVTIRGASSIPVSVCQAGLGKWQEFGDPGPGIGEHRPLGPLAGGQGELERLRLVQRAEGLLPLPGIHSETRRTQGWAGWSVPEPEASGGGGFVGPATGNSHRFRRSD
jgi:hypothetical protein